MRTIHRHTVHIGGLHDIALPEGAEVVHTEMQRGPKVPEAVEMWVLVDMDRPLTTRTFIIHGTGHKIDEGEQYVGTGVSYMLVWHLFEVVGK